MSSVFAIADKRELLELGDGVHPGDDWPDCVAAQPGKAADCHDIHQSKLGGFTFCNSSRPPARMISDTLGVEKHRENETKEYLHHSALLIY